MGMRKVLHAMLQTDSHMDTVNRGGNMPLYTNDAVTLVRGATVLDAVWQVSAHAPVKAMQPCLRGGFIWHMHA